MLSQGVDPDAIAGQDPPEIDYAGILSNQVYLRWLEDMDDVQAVHSNADLGDAVYA